MVKKWSANKGRNKSDREYGDMMLTYVYTKDHEMLDVYDLLSMPLAKPRMYNGDDNVLGMSVDEHFVDSIEIAFESEEEEYVFLSTGICMASSVDGKYILNRWSFANYYVRDIVVLGTPQTDSCFIIGFEVESKQFPGDKERIKLEIDKGDYSKAVILYRILYSIGELQLAGGENIRDFGSIYNMYIQSEIIGRR